MSGLAILANNYDSDDQEDEFKEEEEPFSHPIMIKQEEPPPLTALEMENMIHQDVLFVLSNMIKTVVKQEMSRSKGMEFRRTRNECEIDLTDDDSSGSSWSLKSDVSDEEPRTRSPKPYAGPKTRGELELEDLPPLERLSIRCPSQELTHIGRVSSVVDRVVIVQSFRGQYPLDLDAVLFLKDGLPLGCIFDVFGPVIEPRYVVRFNTNEDITSRSIAVDTPVYFGANLQPPFTSYVFTSHLMAMKGSDASWKHNNEPPDHVKEYSDDEEERKDRVRQHQQKRKIHHNHGHHRQ